MPLFVRPNKKNDMASHRRVLASHVYDIVFPFAARDRTRLVQIRVFVLPTNGTHSRRRWWYLGFSAFRSSPVEVRECMLQSLRRARSSSVVGSSKEVELWLA